MARRGKKVKEEKKMKKAKEVKMPAFVVPEAMQPREGVTEKTLPDGSKVLMRNDVMFTGYKFSIGEHSDFFLLLRDGKIIGHRCPSCGAIEVPPFQRRHPHCGFAEMALEELSDVGVLDSSAAITMFPPARFKDEAPFATAYVYLEDVHGKWTDSAVKMRCRTTKGMVLDGIFDMNTLVKVVFRESFSATLMDAFAVPHIELTPSQILKSPLMESDLTFAVPQEPEFSEPNEEQREKFNIFVSAMREFCKRIANSRHAQNDLANWNHIIRVKTSGGKFLLFIEDGFLRVEVEGGEEARKVPKPVDLLLAIKDTDYLFSWLDGKHMPTNLVLDGLLWVRPDKKQRISAANLQTIFRLDRLPRSLKRDGV